MYHYVSKQYIRISLFYVKPELLFQEVKYTIYIQKKKLTQLIHALVSKNPDPNFTIRAQLFKH